ncbi:hypothetical protein QFX18_05210 [Saccharophagus degradans]|uniref:hypothetical protein n=1 Tax=Saccharophagus degradans TaxID=86304 RepID=UPI0024780ACD|nr:hypothetical protein [Saccharophagus degradans]WGO99459.1 hypothetical protein QFX18_05210 [Saccharophagus degradans]
MKKIRIFLVVWGFVCLVTPVLSALKYPLMKLTTEGAMHSIENSFINIDTMAAEEKKSYDFLKSWILGNDKMLKKSAKVRQYAVMFLGVSTSLLCFLGAIYLPYLTRRSS